jgi:CubicO group peptidase (beta-lactamase class C family)
LPEPAFFKYGDYNMKKIIALFSCFILLGELTIAQGINRSSFIKDSLDIYVSRALTNWRIPGAAVCIIKDDKIVVMKGYGIKELGLADKVDKNTAFMIGGNTRAFTATALAMLQAANKLSLDDKVTKYLPEFKLENKAAGEQATLRDLLSNRIGFKSYQGDFTFYNTNLTRQQVIARMSLVKAAYPLGSKWGNANSAYTVVGEIIPWVAGKTWEDYLKDNIFLPLGMNNTTALSRDMPFIINRTVAHTLVDGRLTATPYAQLDGIAPAGSICSSVNDLSKWVMALLDDGKVNNKQLIPLAAIQATIQPQIVVGNVHHLNGETDEEQYGLGWFLENYAGRHLLMHDGDVNGYLSSITLVPDEHLGIIVLTNTDQNKFFDALRWEIIDAYFKQPYRDYSDTYLATYKANTAKVQQTDKRLRDSIALNQFMGIDINSYTGRYNNELYGNMMVTRGEGNDLEMRFEHHPKMYVHLQPLGGNRFYATFSDPIYGKAVFPFVFQNGRITGVRVRIDKAVESDPYDFKKIP